jgi:hypothetical protein
MMILLLLLLVLLLLQQQHPRLDRGHIREVVRGGSLPLWVAE